MCEKIIYIDTFSNVCIFSIDTFSNVLFLFFALSFFSVLILLTMCYFGRLKIFVSNLEMIWESTKKNSTTV